MVTPEAENLNVNKLSLSPEDNDDFVDPWSVSSKSENGVDYDKLISNFNFNKTYLCHHK